MTIEYVGWDGPSVVLDGAVVPDNLLAGVMTTIDQPAIPDRVPAGWTMPPCICKVSGPFTMRGDPGDSDDDGQRR